MEDNLFAIARGLSPLTGGQTVVSDLRPQLFLLCRLIVHSSMNRFSQHSRQFILSISQVFEARETIFYSF